MSDPTPQPEPLSAEEEAVLRAGMYRIFRDYVPIGEDMTIRRLLATLDAAREQAATEARRELDVDMLRQALFNTPAEMLMEYANYIGAAEVTAAEYRRLTESSPSPEEPTDG